MGDVVFMVVRYFDLSTLAAVIFVVVGGDDNAVKVALVDLLFACLLA